MDLDLEPALVDALHDALDRQRRLGGLDERIARVIAGRAPEPLRDDDAAVAGVDHDAVHDVALAGGDVSVRVHQLGDLDHRLGDAGPELEERCVVAELDDLARDLVAHLEAAPRGSRGGGEHVGERALVGSGRLGDGRGLTGGRARLGGCAAALVPVARGSIAPAATRAAVAVVRAIAAGRTATGRPALRRGRGARRRRRGAGLLVGQPLPERPGIVRRGRRRVGREHLDHGGLDAHARGRGLHVSLAHDDRTLRAGLLLVGHAGVS